MEQKDKLTQILESIFLRKTTFFILNQAAFLFGSLIY